MRETLYVVFHAKKCEKSGFPNEVREQVGFVRALDDSLPVRGRSDPADIRVGQEGQRGVAQCMHFFFGRGCQTGMQDVAAVLIAL